MKSLYWRRNACKPDSFFLAASSLGPYFASRCFASAALKPFAGSTSSARATSSGDWACQAGLCLWRGDSHNTLPYLRRMLGPR